MSLIVECKAGNYEKQFFVKFRQRLRKYSILQMVRFFLRSVYSFAFAYLEHTIFHRL